MQLSNIDNIANINQISILRFANQGFNKSLIIEILDSIIPEKYVNIIARPYGSPYNLEHNNMKYIFNTDYLLEKNVELTFFKGKYVLMCL